MNFYEIILETENNRIPYNVLCVLGDFTSTDKSILLFTDMSKKEVKDKLQLAMRDNDQFLLREISVNNNDSGSRIDNWIKNKLIDSDIKKFEEENQELLIRTMKELDSIGKKRGVSGNGKKKSKNKQRSKNAKQNAKQEPANTARNTR